MSVVKDRLGALRGALAPLEFLPVLAVTMMQSVSDRARKARKDGEKGAVSIEQAIITIAVIAFAILIVGSIWVVVKQLNSQVSVGTVPGTGK